MKKIDYIYGLFYIQNDTKLYYYVGITKDHERREREHTNNKDMFYKRGSKDGTVKAGGLKKGKYGAAAQLEEYKYYRNHILENKYQDGFEVLETVKEGEIEITEDAVMSRMIMDGHPLQNSKAGEKWVRWEMLANRKVRTVNDVEKSDKQDADPVDNILDEVQMMRQAKATLLAELKKRGWKDNIKNIGRLEFKREHYADRYYLLERRSGVGVYGKSYSECYGLMSHNYREIEKKWQ